MSATHVMFLRRRLTLFLWAALALGCGRSELLAPGFASASGQSSSSSEVSSPFDAGISATLVQPDGSAVRDGGLSCGTGSCAVLFGGWNNSALADTWVWDGTRWTEQSVPGPSARSEAVMANLNGKPVLFGGAGAYPAGYLADTWVWDGVWTKLDVTGPPARAGAVMAPLDGKLVLFGGWGLTGNAPLADTWTWDGTAWTRLGLEGPSGHPSDVLAPLDGVLVLSGDGADTWTFDGAHWSIVAISAGPPVQLGATMAPQAGSLVLFGGSVFLGAGCAAETWTWDGSSWAQLAVTGPVRRCVAVMASLKDGVLLFGRAQLPGYLADTWMWNGATWAEETVVGPSKRSEAVMTVW